MEPLYLLQLLISRDKLMDDLIEALQIASKYMNEQQWCYPTNCSHDELLICVDETLFTPEDKARMEELDFFVGDEGGFKSFRFGSC